MDLFQKQSHTITRYRRHILEYKTFGCIFNSNVNIDCKYHYDYSNRSNAKKQTPDGLFQSISLARNFAHKIIYLDKFHYLARVRSVPAGVWKIERPKRLTTA